MPFSFVNFLLPAVSYPPIVPIIIELKEAAAPVEKQAEPVKEAAPPVEKQAEPVKEAPAPVEKEAAPVENQGEPVLDFPVPQCDSGVTPDPTVPHTWIYSHFKSKNSPSHL